MDDPRPPRPEIHWRLLLLLVVWLALTSWNGLMGIAYGWALLSWPAASPMRYGTFDLALPANFAFNFWGLAAAIVFSIAVQKPFT